MSNHTRGGPPGTRYSMSDSGWMETANFHEWFVKLFLPAVSDMLKTGPVLLFLDGHKSHEAIDLLEIAKSKGVIMYMLPPHTTHILQPLDVGVFGPLKQQWTQTLKHYKLETLAAKVDRLVFPSLITRMWDKVLLPEHLIGGFRLCGLHPLSREAIPDSKLKTSVPFEAATKEAETPQLTSGATATNDPATPVTQHIAQYFGNLFIDKQKKRL